MFKCDFFFFFLVLFFVFGFFRRSFRFLFLELVPTLGRGVDAGVLAFPTGPAVTGHQQVVTVATGRPGDDGVHDRVGVAARQATGIDVGVVAAEAVFVACFARFRIVRAVARDFAAIEAHGHAGRSQQVIDVAEARGEMLAGDEGFQFAGHLGAREAHRGRGPFEHEADLVAQREWFGVDTARGGVGVVVDVGALVALRVDCRAIGLVRVLAVDRKDGSEIATGSSRLFEVAVDRALPFTPVVVGGIPVDRVHAGAVQHRIARRVGVGRGLGSSRVGAAATRLHANGDRTHRCDDGARGCRREQHCGSDRRCGARDDDAPEGARSCQPREQAREDGHEPLIGSGGRLP